jgi:general secretion pathway protein D
MTERFIGLRLLGWLTGLSFGLTQALPAQVVDSGVVVRGDSVIVRLIDVELAAAIRALGAYLDRPIVFGALSSGRVSVETPQAIPRHAVIGLLRGLAESNNLELVTDSAGVYRVRPLEGRGPSATLSSAGAVQVQTGSLELFTIHLRHARAADVAAIVNALYGRADALGELGAGPPRTLRDQLRETMVPPGVPQAATPSGQPASLARAATFVDDVTIVPDPSTNTLLIRAVRGDFTLIEAAVSQVDVRPLQVLIEVLIVELRRDRSFSFGVGADLPRTSISGSTNTTVQGSTTGLGLTDFAIKVMGIGGVDLEATLRAAAANGEVRIVSRPIILAANNEPSEILVGSQRPFVQVQRSLPTDSPVRDQIIQYKDVGTQLTVRPTISADGYIRMEVTQEVNSATAETAFDAPVISTRSVRTQLLVRDSQTVVLGGLTDRQKEATQGGVPLLSRIPLLGGLFGRANRRTTETELFLFLTPRIIRTDADADGVTKPLLDRSKKPDGS